MSFFVVDFFLKMCVSAYVAMHLEWILSREKRQEEELKYAEISNRKKRKEEEGREDKKK